MRMYTQFVMGVNLVKSTPDYVIDILNYMLNPEQKELNVELPNHPLFKTERWRYMLVSDSAYFGGHSESSLLEEHNSVCTRGSLSIRCSLKNYDSEIELFLHFIEPWMLTCGCIGYILYEGCDCPELIIHRDTVFDRFIELVGTEEAPVLKFLNSEWLDNVAKQNEKARECLPKRIISEV